MISPPNAYLWLTIIVFIIDAITFLAVAATGYFIQKRPFVVPLLLTVASVGIFVFTFRYMQLTVPGFYGYPILSEQGRKSLLVIAVTLLMFPVSQLVSWDREIKIMLEHVAELEGKRRATEHEKETLRRHIQIAQEKNAEQQQMFQEFKYLILTNVGHELRTPLTFILGFLPMIISGTFGQVVGTPLYEPIENVHASTRRLFAVIKRMITATLRDPDMSEMEITAVAKQALADADIWLNTRRKREDVTITYDIPDRLVMVGDQDMLHTAIVELLNNAIKFDAKHIHLTIYEQDDEVIMRVQDDGIGVSRKHHRDIFEPFFQVRMDSKRPYEGAGAGLAAVENVARKHHGHVFVQSAGIDKGSTFNLIIPVRAPEAA